MCLQTFSFFYPVSPSSPQLLAAADALVICLVLLLCSGDIKSSDLGLLIGCLDCGFCGLPHSRPTNGGVGPQNSQWPCPYTSLHIHYLLVILWLDAAYCELLKGSVSEPSRNTRRGIQSFSVQTLWFVRFGVLLVETINTLLFWLMTPCTLVDIPTFLRRFSCPGMSHCAVGCLVPDISKEHSTSIFSVKKSLFWTVDPEDEEGTVIICIVKNYTHHDMMSQPNGIES